MRWGVLVLLAAVGLLGCTTPAPRPASKPTSAFIEETAIDVPERSGDAVLVNASRAGIVAAGIDAVYRSDRLTGASIDLFVYPAGRMQPEEGLLQGQREFRESLDEAQNQNLFHDLQVDEPEPFPFAGADGVPRSAYKNRLRFSKPQGLLESRAWLTYKQNYWFKLRMTATPELASDLDAIGDEIARDVFSRAEALSKGNCASITLTLPPQPTFEQLTEAAMAGMKQRRAAGCVEKDYPELPPGYRRTVLLFEPDSWSESSPAR